MHVTKDPIQTTSDAVPEGAGPRHRGRVLRGMLGVAVAGTLISAMAGVAGASPPLNTGSTTANVGVESGITMTGLTSSFTLTGTPGATVSSVGAVTFNVETNNVAGYVVTVESESATMDPVTGGNLDTIPIGDLTVRETGTSTYTALSGPISVHSQSARSLNGGDDLSNDFQIRVPVVNTDTYTATLDYVATSL